MTGTVTTGLTPPADGTKSSKLSFTHHGEEVIRVSQAIALDARGRRLPLSLEYSGGRLSMSVPASWVAEATLPLTIDPIIGSPFLVSQFQDANASYGGARPCETAYNSSANEWLGVWSEQFGGVYDIFAQRISSTGALLGSRISVATDRNGGASVTVSHAPSVNRYLVSWSHGNTLEGRLINSDGTFFTGILALDSPGGTSVRDPSAAFDGTNWYVCYAWAASSTNDIKGRFVDTNGTAGTSASPDLEVNDAGHPSVAFSSGTYMIAWDKVAGSTWTVAARTMMPSGTFPTPITTVASGMSSGAQAEVVGGSGKFLFLWAEFPASQWKVLARIANTSLTFETAIFDIDSDPSISFLRPRGTFSATNSQWFVAYKGNNDIYARRVNLAGGPQPREQMTFTNNAADRPEVDWNSQTNEVLIVYMDNFFPYKFWGQRYGMPPAPPPPPPAPTGLAATGSVATITLNWTGAGAPDGYGVFRATVSGGPYTNLGTCVTTSFVDNDVIPGTTYYYVVAAFNAAGYSSNSNEAFASATLPSAATVLFVVGNTTLNPGDNAVKNRLQDMGYALLIKSHSAATLTADATGKAFVAISSTVTPGTVGTKLRTVTVPVLTWESGQMRDIYLGMTGPASGTNFGTQNNQTALNIVNPTHPMAAGLPSGDNPVSASRVFSWAKPSLSPASQPIIIAKLTTGDTERVAIYGYETGTTMVGLTAPAPTK